MSKNVFLSKQEFPTKTHISRKYPAASTVWDLGKHWLVKPAEKPSWGWPSNKHRPTSKK